MDQVDVYVLGLDDDNLAELRKVPDAGRYRFHPLLTIPQLQFGEIPVAELLEEARGILKAADPPPDAIVGFWDFPVSTMVPILCGELGLPSAPLEAVLKCEHKYWSRLEQAKVIDEYPRFALVDPDVDPAPPDLPYPFWLKPVKGFSSELAFKVEDEAQFHDAVARTRDGIGRVGEPFQYILDRVDVPAEIAEVGGRACLAEEALTGRRAATEGYVHHGEVTVYGTLDSIPYSGRSSFLRHQYPSQLPEATVRRLEDVSGRAIAGIGLDDATFSIEFFCDPDADTVSLLEINPRHSQSHAELFELVDGAPNHQAMLALALGEAPVLPHRKGEYGIAAKWYHRRFADGVLRRGPDPEDVRRIERDIPGVAVHPLLEPGQRLSELPGAQDSYSFEITDVIVAARDEAELVEKYERVVAALPYEFEEIDA
jgi:hypothetical protein